MWLGDQPGDVTPGSPCKEKQQICKYRYLDLNINLEPGDKQNIDGGSDDGALGPGLHGVSVGGHVGEQVGVRGGAGGSGGGEGEGESQPVTR